MFSIYISAQSFLSFYPISLDRKPSLSLSQTLLNHTLHLHHSIFGLILAFSLWYDLFSIIYHAFHTFWPNFWGFWKFLGVFQNWWIFVKFLGWVFFKWSYMLMHCITFAFSQCFMHYRCVFSMLKPCVLVGLDWVKPMMIFLLHVTWPCIHTILFSLFGITVDWSFFICLSVYLSLSQSTHGT